MRRFILTFLTILTAIVLVLTLLWAVFVAPLAHADAPATFTYIGPGPMTIETTPNGPNWLVLAVGWGMVLSGIGIVVSLFFLIRRARMQASAPANQDQLPPLIDLGVPWVPVKGKVFWPTPGYDIPTNDDLQDGGNISSVGILTNFPSTQSEPGNDPCP